MPTYVYQCSACETTFEADQRITEAPLTTCECGSEGTVKRIIQPIAVMFKGSGFHINDYAPSAATKETAGPKQESVATESKPEPAKATTPPTAAPAPSAE